MKRKIKLFFTDFWPTFNIGKNYFTDLLSINYDIEITDDKPEFLIYSCFGFQFQKFNCIRIFFTGENFRPNLNECDYSFSFDYSDNPRCFRLPLYTLYFDLDNLTKKKNVDELMTHKNKFCNFIYSNPTPKKRIEFFRKLNKYKKVDSGGRVLNNLGYNVVNKIEFLKNYKFTIAFESESYPGYTSEKIIEPMIAGSLPIYWGNEFIGRDFNTNSFLNLNDFHSDEEMIEKIIELDNNDELYKQYLIQPWFNNNKINEFANKNEIIKKFDRIFNEKIIPVSNQSKVFSKNLIINKFTLLKIFFKYYLRILLHKIINFSFRKFKIKFDKIRGE